MNDRLTERGRRLGLDICVIRDLGTGTASDGMVATTFEAIIAAVYIDSRNDLDSVETIMERLGFFDHPLLQVTFCNTLPLCFTNIQKLTNMQCIDTG